ncbi:MAG: hypothetical protein ABIF12_03785 [bacterium]
MKTIFFIFLFSFISIFSKEILVEGSSRVKQTKFVIKSGQIIFTEKYQNINGKATEEWNINNTNVLKDEYFKQMAFVHQEELEIQKEAFRKKEEEELELKRVALLKKQQEQEEFSKNLKIQTLKRLVSLELEAVEREFKKIEDHQLEEYLVFEHDSFYSSQDYQDAKDTLLNRARAILSKEFHELDLDELRQILAKLELLPQKINNLFRSSIKFAINSCSDTKKLKQLLSLI